MRTPRLAPIAGAAIAALAAACQAADDPLVAAAEAAAGPGARFGEPRQGVEEAFVCGVTGAGHRAVYRASGVLHVEDGTRSMQLILDAWCPAPGAQPH